MKITRHWKAVLTAVLIVPVLVQPAKAIFGLGDVVFDPTAFATLGKIWSEDISTGAKIIQEVNQLTKIYTTGFQLYQSAMFMRQAFSGGLRGSWLMAAEMPINNITQSKFGETISWPRMINGVPSMAPAAWASATTPMGDSASLVAGMNPQNVQQFAAQMASVEIIDGASIVDPGIQTRQ